MVYTRLTPEDLKKAIDDCDARAMLIRGKNLIYGGHGRRDPKLGVDYISTAAALGDPKAQVQLGHFYMEGFSVERDPEEGFKYIKMAADQGYPDGIWMLSRCFADGKGAEHNMSIQYTLCRSAAQKGHVRAMYDLGMIYMNDQDYMHAVHWIEKAASKSDPDAQYELGMLYYEGKGVKQSYKKAFKWFRLASYSGKRKAYTMVVRMLRHGEGIDKDVPAAISACEEGLKHLAFEPVREMMDMLLNEPGYADATKALALTRRIINEE